MAGDPSTEPVATAQQSHVDGRVGPPSIAADADADAFVPDGVEQVKPGTVLPADDPWQARVRDDEGDVDATVEADAMPGGDVKQSQRSGLARSDADRGNQWLHRGQRSNPNPPG